MHYKHAEWFSEFSSGDLCYLFLEESLISLFFSSSWVLVFRVGRGVYFIPSSPGDPGGSSWCLAEQGQDFRMKLKMWNRVKIYFNSGVVQHGICCEDFSLIRVPLFSLLFLPRFEHAEPYPPAEWCAMLIFVLICSRKSDNIEIYIFGCCLYWYICFNNAGFSLF